MNDASLTPVERLLNLRESAEVPGAKPGSAVLAGLLTCLQVPASLLGGKRLAGQASRLLLRSLRTQPAEELPRILEYIRELRWVVHHANSNAETLFKSEAERKGFLSCTGGNPFVDSGAQEYALCCLLCARYQRPAAKDNIEFSNLREQFDALRIGALLTHITAIGYWARHEDWLKPKGSGSDVRASMYRRTLAIRHFVMKRYQTGSQHHNALEKVPVDSSRAELMNALLQTRKDLPVSSEPLEQQLRSDLASILALLRVADDPKSLRGYMREAEAEIDGEESSAPPKVGPEGAYLVETYEDEHEDDDEENDTGEDEQSGGDAGEEGDESGVAGAKGVTYTRTRWNEDKKRACIGAGINPADVLPVENLHLSTRRNGDSGAWQAMKNQNLSFAWRNLAMEELAIGLQILGSQMDRSAADLEIYALAKTIVARGLTLKSAQSMEVRSDRPSKVEKLTLLLPDSESEYAEWLVPAVAIPYQQEHGIYAGCRLVKKSFVSPDYWGLGILLRRLIAVKFPGWNGEPLQPFAQPVRLKKHPKTFPRRLKQAFENANSDRGPGLAGRVTFERLGRVLWQRIYDQTVGNLDLATYVTLRKERAGEDGRFYATPAVHSVQQAELAAVFAVDAELRVIGYETQVNLSLIPSDSLGYLGSPMCPSLEAIEIFLAKQVAIIAASNNILSAGEDIGAIIARHNAYTLLTFCAVSIGTCHRPTHSVIPDLSAIDASSSCVSLIDKGNAKARLGVAAAAAVAQLKAYRAYVETFEFKRLFGARPELPLFFILPSNEFVAVSVATLTQQSLPYVANFARHLAKTILSEWCEAGDERVSPERIAALLGHFIEGEEQFGPYSVFDYKSFVESMGSALGSLLTKVKFQPMDILGKRIIVHAPHIQRFLESAED